MIDCLDPTIRDCSPPPTHPNPLKRMEKSRVLANAALPVSSEAKTENDNTNGSDADVKKLLQQGVEKDAATTTNDDRNKAAILPATLKIDQVGHTLGSYKHRYRARVPLKTNPAPPASASTSTTTAAATTAEKSSADSHPSTEQKELVRQVQSGTMISILWRHGRRMGYDDEGKIIYYSGEDEYYRAKVMRWKQFRRRRTFRLIYDDGYCENEVPLIDETFRILELQDSEVVEQEGGLFLV